VSVNGGSPYVTPGSGSNVIVCVLPATAKLGPPGRRIVEGVTRLVGVDRAGAWPPPATPCCRHEANVVVAELNVNREPELAVALTVNGGSPRFLFGRGEKVMAGWRA
jgi:hypothetical protein